MRITLPFDIFATADRRKSNICKLLRTKKYKQYFYRVSGIGKIPPSAIQKFFMKIKTAWGILVGKFDANVRYSIYLNEVMHRTHMKSLLEKQLKMKSLGIVPEHDSKHPVTAAEKLEFQQMYDETINYQNEINKYLKNDPAYKKMHDDEVQKKLAMMKLYVDSNGITENSLDTDKYIQLVSIMRERDE